MLIPMVAMAEFDELDMRNQMLDDQIATLTQQRDEKYAALEKCEKSTKGFKIAGLTTLVATGIGVYGNIKLSQKIKGKTGSSSGGTKPSYSGTDEQLLDSNCKTICDTTDKTECEECLKEFT